jgi:beta-glucosidase
MSSCLTSRPFHLTIAGLAVVTLAAALFFIFNTRLINGYVAATGSASTIDERVEQLLSQMTLEEKIGQMALVEKNSLADVQDIATYKLGGLLSGAGSKPEVNTPEGWLAMVTGYQKVASSTRLGIPLLYGVDAVHGHGNMPGATIFPHQIGLGATGDADLVYNVAAATAAEVKATGINWTYSPNLDLPHDIRWGRVYEAFGDQSSTTAVLGEAFVRGTQQGTGDVGHEQVKLVATAKHFIGLGSMLWRSSSNKNFKIDQGHTPAEMDTLRMYYLPPFKAAVDAGVLSVMVGLNTWGDKKMVTQKELLTSLLKGELGFKGIVVSDWYGVYDQPGFKFFSTVRAINAGVDMVMLPFEYQKFERDMWWANRLGFISTSRIDDAVRRILRAKFMAGLFDTPLPAAGSVDNVMASVHTSHRVLAREAVAKSLVLLKNENAALPISLSAINRTHIIVAGSAADNTGYQSGAWTLEWQGVTGDVVPGATSILEGIKSRVGSRGVVDYYKNDEALPSAKKATYGIVVVGESPYAEGWGDREFPTLSYDDIEVIKKLRTQVEKLIVITVSGRPLFIEREVSLMDALVAAWLPGSAGEGVADVLFGEEPFVGRLPVAWPKTSEQLPLSGEGQTADGTAILFPSGFSVSQSR